MARLASCQPATLSGPVLLSSPSLLAFQCCAEAMYLKSNLSICSPTPRVRRCGESQVLVARLCGVQDARAKTGRRWHFPAGLYISVCLFHPRFILRSVCHCLRAQTRSKFNIAFIIYCVSMQRTRSWNAVAQCQCIRCTVIRTACSTTICDREPAFCNRKFDLPVPTLLPPAPTTPLPIRPGKLLLFHLETQNVISFLPP